MVYTAVPSVASYAASPVSSAAQVNYLSAPGAREGGQVLYVNAPTTVLEMVPTTYAAAPAAQGLPAVYLTAPMAAAPAVAEEGQAVYLEAQATVEGAQATCATPIATEGSKVVNLDAPTAKGPVVVEEGQVIGASMAVEGAQATDASPVAILGEQEANATPVVMEVEQAFATQGPVEEGETASAALVTGAEVEQAVAVVVTPVAVAETSVVDTAGQATYVAGVGGEVVPPLVVAATPARVTVSPEVFAKLARGGTLTSEEMAKLMAQSAPDTPALQEQQPAAPEPVLAEAAVAATPEAGTVAAADFLPPASAEALSGKEESSASKGKALKASKKKRSKGCC